MVVLDDVGNGVDVEVEVALAHDEEGFEDEHDPVPPQHEDDAC